MSIHRAAEEGEHNPVRVVNYYTWIEAGNFHARRTRLRADALTTMMLVMITFIGTLIAIYAVGYMHGDPGYPRFFAECRLFIFSMTALVLADNFILLYAGWEGVGPVQLPADRLLVQQAGGRGGGPQGVPGHAHRRRRLDARHPAAVDYSFGYHARLSRSIFDAVQRRCTAGSSISDVLCWAACCCSAARSASRRSFRCTSGCPTRWKARRRSAP